MQLYGYHLTNKHIRKHNEAVDAQEKGEATFDSVYAEELKYFWSY